MSLANVQRLPVTKAKKERAARPSVAIDHGYADCGKCGITFHKAQKKQTYCSARCRNYMGRQAANERAATDDDYDNRLFGGPPPLPEAGLHAPFYTPESPRESDAPPLLSCRVCRGWKSHAAFCTEVKS
jgi:hypothetical protein